MNGVRMNLNLITFSLWMTSNSSKKRDGQIDTLAQTVFTFSEDIGMEFDLKKCGGVILKKEKLVKFVGIYLPN